MVKIYTKPLLDVPIEEFIESWKKIVEIRKNTDHENNIVDVSEQTKLRDPSMALAFRANYGCEGSSL